MTDPNSQAPSQTTKGHDAPPWPHVSVVIPVLNEETHISDVLRSVLEQEYPADLIEILVADGRSTDRTRNIIESAQVTEPRIRLIDNPQRIVPTGLNRALEAARGEVIVRMDGHCEYPRDYVKAVVRLRQESGAANAGGVLVPAGRQYISRAVAAAYYSPLAAGPALRGDRSSSATREVDSVHGGCWEKSLLMRVGGFDEGMVRNQDDELSFRLRKQGGRIVQSPAILVRYWVRNSFQKLFRQFSQYGYWKVRVIEKHPRQASYRHVMPSALILALLLTGLAGLGLSSARWVFLLLTGGYLAGVAAEGFRQSLSAGMALWPGITLSLVLMQMGYGLGFLAGLARRVFGPLPTDRIFEKPTR